MNALITRGLKKSGYNSLITRGFESVFVPVEVPAGSITRLFPRNYIPRNEFFDIDGKKLFDRKILLFIKGILAFYNVGLYNIVGHVGFIVSKLYNITALQLINKLLVVDVSAIDKVLNNEFREVYARLKIFVDSSKLFIGISAFYRGKKIDVLSILKQINFSAISLSGIKRLNHDNNFLIAGKKNITNLLMAVGILTNNKKE